MNDIKDLKYRDLPSGSIVMVLRPHHGMCFAFFEGKGYSDEFVTHMTELVERFEDERTYVELTEGLDLVCSRCPNAKDGLCSSQDDVEMYDRKVLEYCGVKSGQIIKARSFALSVQENIFDKGLRKSICGSCEWNSICEGHESRWRKYR